MNAIKTSELLNKLIAIFMLSALLCVAVQAQPTIIAKALYKNGAVLEVDGKQRMLKVGKRSPEGIELISANSKKAVIEYQGTRQTVTLSKAIKTTYAKAEKTEARIQSGLNGHFFVSGSINGRAATFMVDTGASSVAMSSAQANLLGIKFSRGMPASVSTAGGVEQGYLVTLNDVSVGGISINNVDAIVIRGNYPEQILLGNSFLNRVDMRVDSGVLILQSKY